MNRNIVLLIVFIIFAASCGGGPIVPTDDPGGGHEPREFCIDFERSGAEGAVNGANATLLYRDLGITFPSNPVIINNGALCGGAGIIPGPINNQCLFQGDPGSARPERSCGPLEMLIDPGLNAEKVEFEARNVGFISTPVEIVATAYGEEAGAEVVVDEYRIVNISTLGDLRPFELVTLVSQDSEPPITKIVIEYGTCPPHVTINDLCINPKRRAVSSIGQTDAGAERLVYYFDNRERHSYIQLANLSNSDVDVHIQSFVVNSTVQECAELNFDDTYSPNDVHTYDTTNMISNTGIDVFTTDQFSGQYGFIVISKSEGPPNPLVGTMTIIDDAGYQYRTNAVAPESVNTKIEKSGIVNFNNTNGNHLSEIIGFTYAVISDDVVYASSGVTTVLGRFDNEILIIDENEFITSCSPKSFSCSDTSTNIGIDISLPNPYDADNLLCRTRIIQDGNNAGWARLPIVNTFCTDPFVGNPEGECRYDTYFVGFIGLNNGSSSGTFDSWWGGKINEEE